MPFNSQETSSSGIQAIKAILSTPGRVLHIVGVEEARLVLSIEHVMLFAKEGIIILPYHNSTHVPGYIFASGQSFEACDEALQRAMSLAHFEMKTIQ